MNPSRNDTSDRSRSRRSASAGAWLLSGLLALGGGVAVAETDSRTPEYRRVDPERYEKRRAQQRPGLPEGLRMRAVESDRDGVAKHAEVPRGRDYVRGPRGPRNDPRGHAEAPDHGVREHDRDDRVRFIDSRARDAAREMADRLARTRGVRQYFRVGFHTGLKSALREGYGGEHEFAAGLRDGRRSDAGRREGRDAGQLLAEERATAQAVGEVEAQFGDLTREPRQLRAPRAPHVDIAAPVLDRVTVRDVMRDYPIRSFRGALGPRFGHFDGWGWDGPRLHATSSHRDFYDRSWQDPSRAFELWCRDHPGAFRKLRSAWERERFIDTFERAFARTIAKHHARALERAYDEGLDDGWSYGAFVHDELQYRRGFNRGYAECFIAAAERSFDRTYPRAWDRAFDIAFEDWSNSIRPAIRDVRIFDGDDDGVFEPGERIDVEFVVVNFGGAAGDVPVRLNGRSLLRDEFDTLYLPARRETEGRLVRATLDPRLRPRSQARLDFSVADDRQRLKVDVRRPLQIRPASLRLERDDLAGQLFFEVVVENVSRRDVQGTIAAQTISGGAWSDDLDLSVLPAGASTAVRFGVDGLDPLDLLSGDVGLELTVDRQGTVQDVLQHAVAEVVTDLDNRSFVRYLVDAAIGTRVSPYSVIDVERVRRLTLQRLQADWRGAVAASGNPYKRDRKRNSDETALGELVTAWSSVQHNVADRDVFGGLEGDVVALSRDLPGVHPLLRKAMRKLAAPLP